MLFRYVCYVLFSMSVLLILSLGQKYNARALLPDYDGQLAPYQVANVTGFAENLQVDKVSSYRLLSSSSLV